MMDPKLLTLTLRPGRRGSRQIKKNLFLTAVWMAVILLFLITGLTFAAGKVEVFSWWTGGGEAQGLQALIRQYEKRNQGVDFCNATVAGGAGTNSQRLLKTRMLGGNPPDSFQVHGGAELVNLYAKTKMLQPLNRLIDFKKFNRQIIDFCSYQGRIYAVPVNIHRGNVLWGNSAILKKYGIVMPTTLSGLLDACKKLQKAGITPVALGDTDKWEATQLFENILAATLGPQQYNRLWKDVTAFRGPGLKKALVQFLKLVRYINRDHSALGWQEAAAKLYAGQAAFTVMGDWAEGYFKSVGWKPGREFCYAPFPGTKGSFMVITDTFVLPKGAPNRNNAIAWLRTVASLQGQDAFNPLKGSIPARLDGNRKRYDSYLQSSMSDFARDALTPSIAHGMAAPAGFTVFLNNALIILMVNHDIDEAAATIRRAADRYVK
jgi:glucose/mannose transport system substrate-binding protein